MDVKLKVQNPDAVNMSMTITMTLADWKRLDCQLSNPRTSLPSEYPAWRLRDSISELVRTAEKEFRASPEDVVIGQ